MLENKTSIYQNSQGYRFEYYTYGPADGYPVLYMHGAVPMPFSKKLICILEENKLYLITVLRPGYGASSRLKSKNVYEYALMLKEWLVSLSIKNCDVLGLSAGSPYCYALAAAYPDLVAGVNICAGIPLANNDEIFRMNARPERFMFSLSKYLPSGLMGKYAVSTMELIEKKKGWKVPECGESMDDVFQKYVRPNWYGIGHSTSRQYSHWGFPAENLSKKIYIYHSRDDEMIPIKIARKSAGLLANSEFYEYEGEAHSSERLLKEAILNIAKRVI